MSGLRLDSRATILKGGKSGNPAVIPGKSAESVLFRVISGLDSNRVMPPTGERLKAEEIAIMRRWIDAGAVWPERTQNSRPSDLRQDHWSFQPVTEPAVPVPKGSNWSPNPIDRFILEKLESKGWTPSPPASPPS